MKLVDKIIEVLEKRGGFDDWWSNIDEDTKEDIKNEINNIL